jgi:hypothetical protein
MELCQKKSIFDHVICSEWRVAVLNKQPWTNKKGWSSSLVVGHGAYNPSP